MRLPIPALILAATLAACGKDDTLAPVSASARVIEAAAQAMLLLANGPRPSWHPNGQPLGTTRPMR